MKHKALEIIKTFSAEEIKKFELYLNSPFCNESKKVYRLNKSLMKFFPTFNSPKLTDEKLSKSISPELKYNSSTMKVLFSKLHKAAETFLLIHSLPEYNQMTNDILRNQFFKRKLFSFITPNVKESEKKLDSVKEVNADYYLSRFWIASDKVSLSYIKGGFQQNRKSLQKDEEYQIERGKYLICFFVTEMIRQYENLITVKSRFNTGSDSNIVLDFFESIDFQSILEFMSKSPEVKKYSRVFETYLAFLNAFRFIEKEENYYLYKKTVIRNIGHISINEVRYHFIKLLKYCYLKSGIKSDRFNYDLEQFEIYKYIIKKGIYKIAESDILPTELFRNVVIHGLRIKKYKWVIDFIKNNVKNLDPEKRLNMYNYALAEYYFYRRMYKNARHYSHKVKLDDFIYKMDMKNLMLVSYFELKEYETAISHIESTNRFLSRDLTLTDNFRKKYKIFAGIVRQLIIQKTSPEKSIDFKIESDIKENIYYKEWVAEKIAEIPDMRRKAI